MEDFLKTGEVVRLLGKHPVTIYRYNKEGLLKPIKIQPGRKRRLIYTLDTLVDYFNGERTRAELELAVMKIREQERNKCDCEKKDKNSSKGWCKQNAKRSQQK